MNCSAGKIGTISKGSARANGLSTPPIGCVLHLPGLPGGGSKIYDRSPYGNIGTITGATWTRLPSGLWVLDFDGTDDYVDCGAGASLNLPNRLTITAWVYKTATGVWQCIASKHDGAQDKYTNYEFRVNSDETIHIGYGDGAAEQSLRGGTVPTSAWCQVVATYDKQNLTLYIDSVEVASKAETITLQTNAGSLGVGRRGGGFPGGYFNGYIALPRIYNRALSAFEIQNRFQREKHLFGVW